MATSEIDIDVPAVLIRIAKTFDPKSSTQHLYEATRGDWKVGKRAEGARFAMAVAGGIVREVYEIRQWHPAGSTPYETRAPRSVKIVGRSEFTGPVAPDAVRERFVGRSVAHYFAKGAVNPILYVNC